MKNSVARIGEIANHVIEDCNDRSKLLATKVPTKLSEWRTEQENFLKVKQDLTEKVCLILAKTGDKSEVPQSEVNNLK